MPAIFQLSLDVCSFLISKFVACLISWTGIKPNWSLQLYVMFVLILVCCYATVYFKDTLFLCWRQSRTSLSCRVQCLWRHDCLWPIKCLLGNLMMLHDISWTDIMHEKLTCRSMVYFYMIWHNILHQYCSLIIVRLNIQCVDIIKAT